jgi:hypothetical protein
MQQERNERHESKSILAHSRGDFSIDRFGTLDPTFGEGAMRIRCSAA